LLTTTLLLINGIQKFRRKATEFRNDSDSHKFFCILQRWINISVFLLKRIWNTCLLFSCLISFCYIKGVTGSQLLFYLLPELYPYNKKSKLMKNVFVTQPSSLLLRCSQQKLYKTFKFISQNCKMLLTLGHNNSCIWWQNI
jgi:hypothetical protein